jgi:hypothetical protein
MTQKQLLQGAGDGTAVPAGFIGFPVTPTNIALIDSAENYSGNTKLGLMVYSHGTTYNGGIAPTITVISGGAISSVVQSQFIPYQLSNGSWRLKCNFMCNVASGTRTIQAFGVNGVVPRDIVDYRQPFASLVNLSTAGTGHITGPSTNSNMFAISHASTTSISYSISADIELNSKPTWAY